MFAAEIAIATVEIPLIAPRKPALLTAIRALGRRRNLELDGIQYWRKLVIVNKIVFGNLEGLETPGISAELLHAKRVSEKGRGRVSGSGANHRKYSHGQILSLTLTLSLTPDNRYNNDRMPTPLHIVFLGTSPFAVPSLKALASDPRFSINLVITQPDRPVGRKQILTPSPVKMAAQELKLPIAQPENIKTFPTLTLTPTLLVVVSYGQLLPQSILDLPTIAPVNVHASLLPKYRGASPMQHSILNGDETTGVTVQRMVKALDAGPILSQESIAIDPKETFQTLHDKLAIIGADLLLETLSKPLKESVQNDSDATFCRKLNRTDGIANPKTMDAATIDRMVRALTPWPGVAIQNNKILKTSIEPHPDAISIPCRDASMLYILSIQPPSGKPMTGRAFGTGHTLVS